MKPNIENLKARMCGIPLTKYQIALSKTEFVKLLDYVTELEKLNMSQSEDSQEKGRYCNDCGDYVGKGCDNSDCDDFVGKKI